MKPWAILPVKEMAGAKQRLAPLLSPEERIGLMQVMPFWADLIGDGNVRLLFDMRSNLRFGCVILRHYLDLENGDFYRALGRYNGSLGRPNYSDLVIDRLISRWRYQH